MLLAFVSGLGEKRNETSLCLIADKPDILAVPVRFEDLRPTVAGVHRISNEEAIIVRWREAEQALEVEAVDPAIIYLTPNLPMRPGFRVKKIRVVGEPGSYRTYYEKEQKGWEEWVANRERA